jgi:hypothetical protein
MELIPTIAITRDGIHKKSIPAIAITRDGRDGILHRPVTRLIKKIETDFEVITEKGTHIGPTGEFNRTQFLDMMRGEVQELKPKRQVWF